MSFSSLCLPCFLRYLEAQQLLDNRFALHVCFHFVGLRVVSMSPTVRGRATPTMASF